MTGYHPRRVAPFGHPWIASCQRFPRAFRRVATSFFGDQRQGIHRVPIIPACSFPHTVPRSLQGRHPQQDMLRRPLFLCRIADEAGSRRQAVRRCLLPAARCPRIRPRSATTRHQNGRPSSCAWVGSHASSLLKVPSVEPRGLEPRTSAVQGRRSPN